MLKKGTMIDAARLERQLHERYAPLLRMCRTGGLADCIADIRVVVIPGSEPPWTDTSMDLAPDEQLTILGDGRVVLNEALGLWFGPRVYLWRRISEAGPVFRGARETATHRIAKAGRLFLGIYPGGWTTPQGDYEGATPLGGALGAVLIRWRSDARVGLDAVARLMPGDALVSAEIARLDAPTPKPAGWEPLWRVGDTDLFSSAATGGRAVIRVRPDNEAAILIRRVSARLTPTTRLRWSWCIEQLPSPVAEDQPFTHDYLSIAVEFENGQDLTYYWSATLPEETAYRCPLPWWDRHETHIAVRSGAPGLGVWRSEERHVRADYQRAVGEPPERIVAVWLIAVSLFSHSRGAADFAEVAIEDERERVPVL